MYVHQFLVQLFLFFSFLAQSMDQASGCLMHILRTEFYLLDHFRMVQLFLLMEAGDTMHHFTSDIFHRVSYIAMGF